MTDYDPRTIETKWQQRWEESGVFRVGPRDPDRPKYYCLEMLPYPSGKIHMGHVRNYSIGDAVARFRAMRGEQVFHVMGWDAFGLPAENAAIKNGQHPRTWTLSNIATMRTQFRRLGLRYDWDREIATCLPEYYRWNQWMFLRMLERGIAYRAKRDLNWCASCGTVLANEQVNQGRCWRCGEPVTIRSFEQWFLRTTAYAEELLDDLDASLGEWPEKVRLMQRNWIGRSDGARVVFGVDGTDDSVEVFTTRVDTIFGATYVSLAAEHPLAESLAAGTPQAEAVRAFVAEQRSRTVEDRFAEAGDKAGVFTGSHAVNPFNGAKIPIWIANFVLMDVGTGAVMSVPAHDDRDFAFARRYGLDIVPVVRPDDGEPHDGGGLDAAFTGHGVLHGSGPYDGLRSEDARVRMAEDAESGGFGSPTVTYRLKDWGLSRQRYWGTPIPVVYCAACGIVPVPETDLPVVLPEGLDLSGSGGSPLSRSEAFVRVACPRCGAEARRETDTMDTFVDSCWYYFRYADPHNHDAPFDWERIRGWFPVDLYVGGIEHATMHLIYTRFWTKVMRDLGLVDLSEPVTRLFTQGMVIKDGAKMSKSKGNVVDPDDMIERYGADTTRLFSMFAAPPERELEWSESGIEGCHRFLVRLWRLFRSLRERLPDRGTPAPEGASTGEAMALRRKTHRTIRRVTDDLGPRMHLNTPVSSLMELSNAVAAIDRGQPSAGCLWAAREALEAIALLLAPFAPHFAEELWEGLGGDPFVTNAAWPDADDALMTEDVVTVVVQVNGKLRARIELPRGASEEVASAAAREDENVAGHLLGMTIAKVIHVPDRLLNLVVR